MKKTSPSPYYLHLLRKHFEQLHSQPRHHFRTVLYSPAPEGLEDVPGVYVIYEQGTVIYVGQSRNLKHRVWGQHRSGRTSRDKFNIYLEEEGRRTKEQRQQYLRDSCQFRFLASEELALDPRFRNLFEVFLIAELDPTLNSKGQ